MVRQTDYFVVRDHHRHADLVADAKALVERIDYLRRFVAHVRAVHAVVFLQRPAHLDDFIGRRAFAGS